MIFYVENSAVTVPVAVTVILVDFELLLAKIIPEVPFQKENAYPKLAVALIVVGVLASYQFDPGATVPPPDGLTTNVTYYSW